MRHPRDAPASARDSPTVELSGYERMCASRLRLVPVTSCVLACCLVCLSWSPSRPFTRPLSDPVSPTVIDFTATRLAFNHHARTRIVGL